MKRIFCWVSFISLAACGFMLMLGLILRNDSLMAASPFALLPAGLLIAAVSFVLIVRWLFSWRNLKRALKVVGVFGIFGIIFYVEEDVRGWLAWHHIKQQAEAAGERLDFASIIPSPIPDDKNFALTPVVASSYEFVLTKDGKRIDPPNTNVVNRMKMSTYQTGMTDTPTNANWVRGGFTDFKAWQTYYRMPETNSNGVTNEFPIAPQPQVPAVDVLLALSEYDLTLEELRQASLLPDSRFPLNYNSEHPFETMLPHLASIKRCAQVLQLRALAELEVEQSDKALDDVKLSLRLIDSIRTEPLLISHLVRIACLSITMQPIWEGVNKHEWSDAQLAEIEQELGKLDFLTDSKLAMRGERNSSLAYIEHMRRHRSYDDFRNLVSFDFNEIDRHWKWSEFPMVVLYHLAPDGWFYQNEATIVKLHQEFWLPTTDPIKHLAIPTMSQKANATISSLNGMPWNYFDRAFLPALGAAQRKFAYYQETADLAQLGCALERYRLAHKQFPETIDALAPQFIAQIPHDVIGGQPLHYRRKTDGKFLLYSIGWNETDEGGQIGLSDSGSFRNDKGDWVWLNP